MELIRNKVSGKYFIVLDDSREVDALVITPDGKVIWTEKHLFISEDTGGQNELRMDRYLTETQMEKYKKYHENSVQQKGKTK